MNEYGDTSPYSAFTKHHPLQMNRIITLVLFIVTFATASAEKGTPALFARILPDRTTLIAGDSMLVSVVLYAQHPIAEAECNSTFKVTGKNGGKCTYRRLNIDVGLGPICRSPQFRRTLQHTSTQILCNPTASGAYARPL